VGGLSVEQLAARLDQRFRLLTGGSRAALARQQTLRATIDWSYDLLNLPERALFNGLSVFAGDWSVEASEAVCAEAQIEPDRVVELLVRLVDKSLVVAEEAGDGTQRYRLLDTLRHYAREQLLASGHAEAMHSQHASYYLRLAKRIAVELAEPRDHAAWLDRLALEERNMRAALDWFQERGGAEDALKIAAVLWRLWEVRGYLCEGRSRLAALVTLPGASAPTIARARVLEGAGVLALYQYDLAAARSYFKESLALFRRHRDQRGTAWALIRLGWLCHDAGRYKAARRFLVHGLALARETCDRAAVARCLSLLGMLAHGELDFATARSLHEQSLAINRDVEDRWGAAWALHLLGRDLLEQVETGEADVPMARTVLERSVGAWRELDERRHQAFANVDLGLLEIRQGDLELGRRRLDESLATFVELDDRGDTVFILSAYADLFSAQRQPDHVVRVLGALSGLMPSIGMLGSPLLRTRTERSMAHARDALPPSVLAAEWAAGQAMSLSQAVAFVREHNPESIWARLGQIRLEDTRLAQGAGVC
jgi:tetratricopeptide (TPR) repeat protein